MKYIGKYIGGKSEVY